MIDMIQKVEKEERVKRFERKETPEQIMDWETFKKSWLTLKESAQLINRTDRYIRLLCENENIDTRTFEGGKFGKRATRCVNREGFLAYIQTKWDRPPEEAHVQPKTPEFTQNQALATMPDFRDIAQGISGNLTILNSNINESKALMRDVFKEVIQQARDFSEKWHQDQEKRREIELQQIELQKKRIETDNKTTDLLHKRMGLLEKRDRPFVIPWIFLILCVFVFIRIISGDMDFWQRFLDFF